MTSNKKNATVFSILTESIGLYFSEFDKFLKYMTYPVLGQIIGVVIIFFTTYFYSLNMPKLIDKFPNLNDFGTLLGISLLITLPGLLIFCSAFWKYLIAYGAINSMFENLQRSKKVYDFEAHDELIKRRTLPFIGLWFILGIFSIIASFPLFWVIGGIFAVYFVLIFQVFTFEPELSPLECFKKSLLLVKGNFIKTFLLLFFVGLLTYCLIPQIIILGFDAIGINAGISNFVQPFLSFIPELHYEEYGVQPITHLTMASFLVQTVIAQIVIQYTLPLRAILWSNWYKALNNGIPTPELPETKSRKKNSKRPSEKLMEESNKKFSKKKIDSNILKRAMEQDDD